MMLPPQQHMVLSYIWEYWQDNKRPPIVKEIAGKMGKSPATIRHHIQALEQKGMVTRIPMMRRSLCLTDHAKSMFHNG